VFFYGVAKQWKLLTEDYVIGVAHNYEYVSGFMKGFEQLHPKITYVYNLPKAF